MAAEKVITGGLTEAEERQLVQLLGKVGQPWSPEFYNALSPLVVATTVELVCWYYDDQQGMCVLLIPRPETDKHYPGQLHSPGTLLRKTDLTVGKALERIVQKELGDVPLIARKITHNVMISDTPRGVENHHIFSAQVNVAHQMAKLMTETGGKFYPVNDLPANTMEHHRGIIAAACRKLT